MLAGKARGQARHPVGADEELRRVLSVVERLRDLAVSVDTTKAVVAEKALAGGARAHCE